MSPHSSLQKRNTERKGVVWKEIVSQAIPTWMMMSKNNRSRATYQAATNMPGIPRIYSRIFGCLTGGCCRVPGAQHYLNANFGCWSSNGMLGEHHHILFHPTLQDSFTTRIYILRASQWLEAGLSMEKAVKQKLLLQILSTGSNLLFLWRKECSFIMLSS